MVWDARSSGHPAGTWKQGAAARTAERATGYGAVSGWTVDGGGGDGGGIEEEAEGGKEASIIILAVDFRGP